MAVGEAPPATADHDPLAALPEPLAARIYGLLRPQDLAAMAQTCKAWHARYPWAGLISLSVTAKFPAALLPHCRWLQTLEMATNRCEAWRIALALLRRHRLPSLTSIVIEHWAGDSPEMLDDLAEALQVQGPDCRLTLAVADREALAALTPRLPLQGLTHLDVNLAYLPEGGVAAIAAAAAAVSPPAGGPDAPRPSAPVTVGVWVCCWGGCPGLPLDAAEELRAALGPRCVGLESINCSGGMNDLLRVAVITPGLTALGFNLEGAPANGPLRLGPIAAAAGPGLRRLTLHGSSPCGWDEDCWGDSDSDEQQVAHNATGIGSSRHVAAVRNPFTRLSGLTRLALSRDWGTLPVPLAPTLLQPLSSTLLDLTVERRRLTAPRELRALSALTRLTSLSLTLDTEPWELAHPRLSRQNFIAHGCTMPAPEDSDTSDPLAGMTFLQLTNRTRADEANSGGRSGHVPAAATAAVAPVAAAALPAVGSPLARVSPRSTAPTISPAGGIFLSLIPSAADADLSWMRELRRLEVAVLEVPLLDLAWLPPSIRELITAKFSDSGETWLRCGRCGGAGGCSSKGGNGSSAAGDGGGPLLPALLQLSLPSLGDDSRDSGTEEEDYGVMFEENSGSSSSSSSSSSSGRAASSHRGVCGAEPRATAPTPNLEDRLLRCIAANAPNLEDLGVPTWQPSVAGATEAVATLRSRLRRFTMVAAAGETRAQLSRKFGALSSSCKLVLVDPPIPVYPWSRFEVIN